ncbi:MAG: DMT family transporter [Acidobacteriota bacterium]
MKMTNDLRAQETPPDSGPVQGIPHLVQSDDLSGRQVSNRPRLLATAEGSRSEAFGPMEWALLVSIALIWGSSFLWIDLGLEGLRPGVIAASRVMLGAAVVFAFPDARRPVDRRDLGRIGLMGVLWMGIPLVLFPMAQQWIDSSVAGMINGAVPLATAAWATLLLRRWPGPSQRLGLLVGFAGVVAIALPQLTASKSTALGAGMIVFCVVLYGLAANLAVPLQQRYGALPVLLRAQLSALAVVVPFGVADLSASRWHTSSLLAMIPLGMLGTGLAFVMMISLVGRVGSTRGSVPIYLGAPVAAALGVLVLGEAVHSAAIVGTALVIGGAWLTSRRDVSPTTAAGPQASSVP